MTFKNVGKWFVVALAVALGCFCGYWLCLAIGWIFLGEYNWWLVYGFSAVGFAAGMVTVFALPELVLLGMLDGTNNLTQGATKMPILHRVATWLVHALALAFGCLLAYGTLSLIGEKFLKEENQEFALMVLSAVGFLGGLATIGLIPLLFLVGLIELAIQKWNSSKK